MPNIPPDSRVTARACQMCGFVEELRAVQIAKRIHVEEEFIRKMEQNQAAVRAAGGPR